MAKHDQYVPPPVPSLPPPAADERQAPLGPTPGVRATMSQMIERMQTAIGTAERAADAIRRDADYQARRHMEAAQQKADELVAERIALIASLTDELIQQAEVVRSHSQEVVQALDSTIASVQGRPPDPAAGADTGSGGWLLSHGEGARDGESVAAQVPREALVHATRLAVAGNDREAICRALREGFGLENPGPIADRALGSAP